MKYLGAISLLQPKAGLFATGGASGWPVATPRAKLVMEKLDHVSSCTTNIFTLGPNRKSSGMRALESCNTRYF